MKTLTLLLIIVLTAASLFNAELSSAQSTPKPSTPEFTLKYADYSYDIPSTTSTVTDPFTGKQSTMIRDGYHVDNRTIILTIKNQPIQSTDQATQLGLYYYVRFKGHYENGENDWMYLPKELKYGYGPASNSTESVWYYQLDSLASQYQLYFPKESEIDFQVQALIGNQTLMTGGLGGHYTFTGEKSGWSNTQTVTINDKTATPTPTIPEYPVAVILPLFIILLLAAALFQSKERFL